MFSALEALEHGLGDIEPRLHRRNDDRHAVVVLRLAVVLVAFGRGHFQILHARFLRGGLEDLALLRGQLVPSALAHDRTTI